MSNFFDKINLRPQERRFLAAVGLVVFIVINVVAVWPHFKDWGELRGRLALAEKKLADYQKEVELLPGLEKKLKEIESADTGAVMPADQSIHFRRTIEALALNNRVFVQSWGNITPTRTGVLSTNQFFEELNLPITVTATEKDLVEFLYKVSSGGSSIRVRDLTLNPSGPIGSGLNLASAITLVASYQKAPVAKAAAPTPRKP